MAEQLAIAEELAQTAGINLVYVNDDDPGYARKRCGRGFTYFHPDGTRVQDQALRNRFAELAIPPAWTDVWICLEPNGHIQATGRDDADRKQYIYHPDWEAMRNEAKFARIYQFGKVLPTIRDVVDADLRKHHLPREKVLALTVALLDQTHIRIGNSSYTRQNGSFGLTTLQDDHAEISSTRVVIEFSGKSGVEHHIDLRNPRLARLVKACQELPGQRLFQYEAEDGAISAVESGDVNNYLRTIAGEAFSAKDFRTWAGTVAAAQALLAMPTTEAEGEREQNIVTAVKAVAEELGNTPAVCRKYYIHPAILDAYLSGKLREASRQTARSNAGEQNAEAVVLRVLETMGYGESTV
ncbi:MAG: DNA topoisomerase IB [Caldilineaceae bacterium]|nr:DNA topoisomerase IB [Caldilineaceae bacterium]